MGALRIFIDGGCIPNPGLMAIVVFCPENDYLAVKRDQMGTSNVAEYAALYYALRYCERFPERNIQIFSDSKLVVNQMTGEWACNDPKLRRWLSKCRALLHERIEIRWIPRESNLADSYT